MADADIAIEVALHVSDPDGASPTVADQLIGGLTAISEPSPTRDTRQVTQFDSPGGAHEFIGGLIDHGEASFGVNYIPGNATAGLLREIMEDRRARVWKITFAAITGAPNVTFNAVMTGLETATPLGEEMTAEMTMKISGVPVWA